MASSRRGNRLGRWVGTAAAMVAGGLLIAGPAVGQAAGQAPGAGVGQALGQALGAVAPKAPGAAAPKAAAAAPKAAEAAAPKAPEAITAAALNEGSAYSVSVSGGTSLSARPGTKTKACPDDQMATLAAAEAAPFLVTGPLDVRVACTAAGGSLRSRAVATNVAVGPEAPARAMRAKVVAAECTVEGGATKGATLISGLEAFGRPLGDIKNPEPNTPLSSLAPGLTGVMNEQIKSDGHIAVNAMRVKLGAVEMILGHVECGKGAAAAAVAKSDAADPAKVAPAPAKGDPKDPTADAKTTTTLGGPTTTKVKGGGKDKDDKAGVTSTTVVTPTTKPAGTTPTTRPVTTTTTTRPAVHDDKVVGKGGKGLAKTGPVTGALLVLAAAALGIGGLLRLGTDGIPALAVARRARDAVRHPRPHQPAASWQPRSARDTEPAGGLDSPARDALRDIDDP